MPLSSVLAFPASEYTAWRAYFEIYPFSWQRADIQHAELVTTIINSQRAMSAGWAGRRSFEPVHVADFLPSYITPEVEVTDPKQRAQYRAWKAQLAALKGETNGS